MPRLIPVIVVFAIAAERPYQRLFKWLARLSSTGLPVPQAPRSLLMPELG
jgi:hypothetical protein